MSDKLTITIDGVELQANPGDMLIQVADEAGIYIPRFCYHNKLSVAANCRMCLVEVEKSPKPQPACATPVMDGMNVNTRSDYAKKAQKNVMEFLLINHPLDCPICDQGGECELQDLAMGYGRDSSAFVERKRAVEDKNLGSLIGTEMTRCIHCTRCVRFGEEIAGFRELGMTGRGMHSEIGTYIAKTVDHELSGNVIDLCPVGALTAKPSRFTARAWEVRQTASIAPHDGMGSNINIHTLRDRINRVVPRDNESINEVWLSDRDRFSYEAVMHEDRVAAPMVKQNGEWVKTDWQTAISAAIDGIKAVIDQKGPESLGAWVSPQSTLEEMFLLQGIVRHLGSNNIDHRLTQTDFRAQGSEAGLPTLGMSIEDVDQLDGLLMVGSNIRKEVPMLAHRIRKAAMKGARVSAVNSRDFNLRFAVHENIVTTPLGVVENLAGIAKAMGASVNSSVQHIVSNANADQAHQAIADSLTSADNAMIMLGHIAQQHPDFSILQQLALAIAESSGAVCSSLPVQANVVGAWQAGIVPHRLPGGNANSQAGKNIGQMVESPLPALILHNVEPNEDCADPVKALAAAKAAEFVVVTSPFVNDEINDYADVILPNVPFTETDGTFVNMEGLAQSFTAAVSSYAESSPAWKIYRVMGEQLGIETYQYQTADEVMADLLQQGQVSSSSETISERLDVHTKDDMLVRCGEQSIYAVDALVRRAHSLQETADGSARRIARMHPETAASQGVSQAQGLKVTQADSSVVVGFEVDDSVAQGCLWLPLIPELGGLNHMATVEAVEAML